jgi:hypothetical protein
LAWLLLCFFIVSAACQLQTTATTPPPPISAGQVATQAVATFVAQQNPTAPTPSLALPSPNSTPASTVRKIILLGNPTLVLGEAAKYIQDQTGFVVEVNADVNSADLVLITIYAPDGLMPATINELERRQNQTAARLAILITGMDDLNNDQELYQLIVREAYETLSPYLTAAEHYSLEFLQMPGPELIDKLQALLLLPPTHIQIAKPAPTKSPTLPPLSKIVLLGNPSPALTEAAQYIQNQSGFAAEVNTNVTSADLVLVVIHAPDGLMRATLDEIERQQDRTAARIAILMTGVDLLNDQELYQLVVLEAQEALPGYLQSDQPYTLEVLQMPNSDLMDKIKALLLSPRMDIYLTTPNR